MRERIREIIMQTCAEMGVHIVKGVLGRDHVHMFLSIPPKLSLSNVMQRIKGRSSRRIQMEFPELRKRYWGRRFWARGYFSTTSGNVTDDIITQYLELHSSKWCYRRQPVVLHFEDMDVMGQTIQQSACKPFGAKDFGPLIEGQVWGYDDGPALVALGYDLEE
jgi:putative transposase